MFALTPKKIIISVALGLICLALILLVQVLNPKKPDWVTATVEKGDVHEIVSVSGFIEAKNTAELAFPSIGKVTEVFVTEGQTVKQGEVLATLAATQMVAQRNDAVAKLHAAQAQYDLLTAGESPEVRSIANTKLQTAEQALARTTVEEKENVAHAKKVLLSDNLSALAKNPSEDAVAPIVSGAYACTEEGTYTVEIYGSKSESGYSYNFSGLEDGSSQVTVDQPNVLGSCGLYLQFTPDNTYSGSVWNITIPNTRSESYIANANAYANALTHQANALAAAEEIRALAVKEADEVNANPRNEELRVAQANINQAQAQVAQIDAQIDDRSVVAPFDGFVTDVSILSGETAPTTPVITVLAFDAFELKARIPEIDIIKIQKDQVAEVVFDAKPTEIQHGTVTYISPLAVKIDGVAYFEATIALQDVPSWIKSGLNADVNILIHKSENVLKIPKRFVVKNADGTASVFIENSGNKASTPIKIITTGNDGFAEIEGLREGQTVLAP